VMHACCACCRHILQKINMRHGEIHYWSRGEIQLINVPKCRDNELEMMENVKRGDNDIRSTKEKHMSRHHSIATVEIKSDIRLTCSISGPRNPISKFANQYCAYTAIIALAKHNMSTEIII
jgi:hypothetical protein